ncbi:hypothetical protein TraAM80_06381 [Trypanosoma rangeli]|uniref:Uncharacterized protein n=1 Tax=Trypanosoma rangeli TaxID=5698 RepID=A0A422NAK0_TRYRA|nr:uncharacterized protein TraAM80_06381 [Trypanosoma rangeli]RNF02485.1 hypothetical protein TraAM80_06381 [Trypanosoma rangeli]|eukprot:RNF02485.1 hypothetical protein TraAM80_06381 [Trypanosoma rangeli]
MNAAWKLLLSVSSLTSISAPVYSGVVQFMLSQLQHHIFSHDWSDGKKIKVASFVASHVVSAVRAHPSFATRDESLVETIVGLHVIVCLTVATSEHTEAARQLHQSIVVRLLAILEAMGSFCSAVSPLPVEVHLRLLLQCLADPPPDATAELPSASVAAGSSVAAFAAMLAATRSFQACDGAYVEQVLAAFLLWLPDMPLVLAEGTNLGEAAEAAATPPMTTAGLCDKDVGAVLCHRVVRHARNLPRAVFFVERGREEAAASAGEVNLSTQLLLLLRKLACRAVDAVRCAVGCGQEDGLSSCGSLLRCRVFGLLMTALLVPNDTSAACVLLVWEAVLNRLSNTDREGLAVELLQLGDEQLRALQWLPEESRDRAIFLRRLLNALAALLAEVCRRMRCPPKLLFEAFSETTAMQRPTSNSISFCALADILYRQSCVYQWWNEPSNADREAPGGTEEAAKSLQDELQDALVDWKHHASLRTNRDGAARLCVTLASAPGRVNDILERVTSPNSITAVLLSATRVLQHVTEEASTPHAVCICARFVAAELIALTGTVLSEDPTFLACIRRLVDISFALTDDGKEARVDGMLRCHAAVCLRNFAQCNTVVPLGKLRLSEAVTTALRTLLQGVAVADADVSLCDCGSPLAYRVAEWQRCLSRCVPTTASSQSTGFFVDSAPDASFSSSQSGVGGHEGRFITSLRRSEETMRSVLQWLKAGRALQPSEEETLVRLEQLACAAANMTHHTLRSNGGVISSSAELGAEATQATGFSPEIIHVD